VFIFPNVYSQTGIESSDLVMSMCKEIKPDLVIFIDALATISLERLCSSFQISNEGIRAGSGANTNNKEMTKKLLKSDVISIGVPMMIYAENLLDKIKDKSKLKDIILSPCDIKKSLNLISDIVSQAINMAIFPQYSKDEIDIMIN
jgi:spore protease